MIQDEAVDHEARSTAARAEQKIDSHEDRCSERWREAKDAANKLADKIDALSARIWWAIGGVISAEFGVIIWLLDKS